MIKTRTDKVLNLLLLLLLVFGIIMVLMPFTLFSKTVYRRSISVYTEHPDGSTIPNLKKGDTIEVSFEATQVVEVFIVKESVARDYREHQVSYNFWGIDVLGPPAYVGKSGEVKIKTNSSGDWTVFFRNENSTGIVKVDYTIRCPNHSSLYFFLPIGVFSLAVSVYLLYSNYTEVEEDTKAKLTSRKNRGSTR